MAPLADLARISKQQGVAAAVALALLLGILYLARMQSQQNGREIAALTTSVDALGDLVISSCGASTADVQKFEKAKRERVDALKR
jgi:hypothetical protein